MSTGRVGALALLLALSGCAHARRSSVKANSQMLALQVVSASPRELQLRARFRLEGLPPQGWGAGESRLSVSLDDQPFAAVVTRGTRVEDQLEVPLALEFSELPPEVALSAREGRPVRVRLRGQLGLLVTGRELVVPADGEVRLSLEGIGPRPRGE